MIQCMHIMCHVLSPHKRGKLVLVISPDCGKTNMFKTKDIWETYTAGPPGDIVAWPRPKKTRCKKMVSCITTKEPKTPCPDQENIFSVTFLQIELFFQIEMEMFRCYTALYHATRYDLLPLTCIFIFWLFKVMSKSFCTADSDEFHLVELWG